MKYVILVAMLAFTACSRDVAAPEKPQPAQAQSPAAAATLSKSVPAGWMEDFSAAKAKAAAEGKFLLVAFSGSDWCHWCVKMEEETYSKPDFVKEASKRFVLVMIDNPRDSSILSPLARTQNRKLTSQFGIRGFPTTLVAYPDGTEVKRFSGYRKGGPSAMINFLEEELKGVPPPSSVAAPSAK